MRHYTFTLLPLEVSIKVQMMVHPELPVSRLSVVISTTLGRMVHPELPVSRLSDVLSTKQQNKHSSAALAVLRQPTETRSRAARASDGEEPCLKILWSMTKALAFNGLKDMSAPG